MTTAAPGADAATRATLLDTPVGAVNVRLTGPDDGTPVVLVHGNLSDARIWDEQAARLPAGHRGVAVDCRGFGATPARPVDATRGLRDLADDVVAAMDALGIASAHLAGHSMGAGVVLQIALDHPDRVSSLVLAAPMPPWGMGATRADGTPTSDDFAGSGGGGANPELVRRLQAGDRTADDPASPRSVIRSLFFPSPEVIRDEELILEGMLATAVGDDHYPGDTAPTATWPGVGPGTRGILNAISPRYCDLSGFATAGLDLPVLWVRGGQDLIISERSMVDFGTLGELELVPGWPGADAHPPQPMVTQMRVVLDGHAARGGRYREVVVEDAGHFVFTQDPDRFAAVLAEHLKDVA